MLLSVVWPEEWNVTADRQWGCFIFVGDAAAALAGMVALLRDKAHPVWTYYEVRSYVLDGLTGDQWTMVGLGLKDEVAPCSMVEAYKTLRASLVTERGFAEEELVWQDHDGTGPEGCELFQRLNKEA